MCDFTVKNTFIDVPPTAPSCRRRVHSAPGRIAIPDTVRSDNITTYIVKGLGRAAHREVVMRTLVTQGLAGRFNYVFVPMSLDRGRPVSRGLAVVNFTDPDAVRLWKPLSSQGKPRVVRPARVQGARENLAEFLRSVSARGEADFENELSRPWVAGGVTAKHWRAPTGTCAE
mmetsp:Transcript_28394/g.73456  ORF Transcript_28394/g.73456 Transcript_28394/m.73456 type:complete len:172 (+) Transcript_28394:56-571(+)